MVGGIEDSVFLLLCGNFYVYETRDVVQYLYNILFDANKFENIFRIVVLQSGFCFDDYFLAENFLGTQSPELFPLAVGSLGTDSLQLLPGSAWDPEIWNETAIGSSLAGVVVASHSAGSGCGHPPNDKVGNITDCLLSCVNREYVR